MVAPESRRCARTGRYSKIVLFRTSCMSYRLSRHPAGAEHGGYHIPIVKSPTRDSRA